MATAWHDEKWPPASAHGWAAVTFFVAHLNEGIALRRNTFLDHAPSIYVLARLAEGTEKDIAERRLIPVLNHPGELRRYAPLRA